ncbi:MAG: hypothetical protein MJB14_18920 [Spirochaetes bacterium]|nr:hypothetical protein [Spirochaetota bacterium]
MNQDQVKEKLLELKSDVEEFSLIFSGKTSKKVNGCYHPTEREIIIHNKNFTDDNSLIYTGIHEFAHHIHFTHSAIPISTKAHTNEFWNTFHHLLFLAEEKGIYVNIFEQNDEFNELTKEIKNNYLVKNGTLVKDLGRLLLKAVELCAKYKIRFEDYVDRGLLLNRNTAKTMMKMFSMDVNPALGYDNMRIATTIKDPEERRNVEEAFIAGETPDMVKAKFQQNNKKKEKDKIDLLQDERKRIERTMKSLSDRLKKVNDLIEEMEVNKNLD